MPQMSGGNSTCSPPVKSKPLPSHPTAPREWDLGEREGKAARVRIQLRCPRRTQKTTRVASFAHIPSLTGPRARPRDIKGQMPGRARVAARRGAPSHAVRPGRVHACARGSAACGAPYKRDRGQASSGRGSPTLSRDRRKPLLRVGELPGF